MIFLMLKHEKLCFNNKKSSVKPMRFYTRFPMLLVLFLHVIETTYPYETASYFYYQMRFTCPLPSDTTISNTSGFDKLFHSAKP